MADDHPALQFDQILGRDAHRRELAEAGVDAVDRVTALDGVDALRESLGQVRLCVNFADLLQSGRIFIVSIAKGKIGDNASRLFGALITSSLSAAAMERSSLPASERRNFTLILDEAQNFLSDAVTSILSESRKFGLGLVLAHQYLDQLTPSLQAATLGNAGSTFAFRLSGEDAERAAIHFGNTSASTFIELPPFTTLVRPVAGTGFPFRLSLDPIHPTHSNQEKAIRAASRRRHYSRRTEIKNRLQRWSSGMVE